MWSTAENLLDEFRTAKQEGLELLRAGDRTRARRRLLEAAKALLELSEVSSGELKEQRARSARQLLESARNIPLDGSVPRQAAVAERGERVDPFRHDGRSGGVTFADIGGLEEVKELLRLKLVYPTLHRERARAYGIAGGGGVLFFGPPGTGKTLLARAVAGEIDAAFFSVKPSEILSKWVGEAEKNVQALFDAARDCPLAVIFVDEIDALAPRRSENQSPVMARLVPQILAELEGFEGKGPNSLLFLGATNEPWSIDPAILRPGRFDEKIYLGLPDPPAAEAILRIHLTGRPVAGDFDVAAVVARLSGYSGADIRGLCVRAAEQAFLREVRGGAEQTIRTEDLLALIRQVRPSVSRDDLARYEEYARRFGSATSTPGGDG